MIFRPHLAPPVSGGPPIVSLRATIHLAVHDRVAACRVHTRPTSRVARPVVIVAPVAPRRSCSVLRRRRSHRQFWVGAHRFALVPQHAPPR